MEPTFHYFSKPSSKEKNAGLKGRCDHPTVKGISLMRWLCKLITPPGGKILDPFVGTGTTGIAAHLEGFDFVGIEKDEHYCELAEQRLRHWTKETQTAKSDNDLPPGLIGPRG